MRAFALIGVLALGGCTAANDVIDAQVRQSAENAINTVVETNFPGVDASPVSNCIVNNASRGEILEVARDSVTGISDSTVSLVIEIAQRPDTVKCIINNGIALFG